MLSQKTGCLFMVTIVLCVVLPRNVFGSMSRMGESRKTPPEFTQRSNNVERVDRQESKKEPTCEELRYMWKSAKRQSRAAEMTNEIPTFRDPFTYNVWEPYYPSTRSNVGIRNLRFRDYSRPVYGRVIHKVPLARVMDIPKRTRTFETVARYGALHRVQDPPRRRVSTFRLPGGGSAQSTSQNAISPQYGTFQRLKELIRTERTRELQEQRMTEEMAARAAAIKEIANGQGTRNKRTSEENSEQDLHI